MLFQIPPGKEVEGLTSDPKSKKPCMWVTPNSQRELEILIHEALHACLWDLAEESVEETARDIAALLEKLGYERKQ